MSEKAGMLKDVVAVRSIAQEQRIAMTNRIAAVERGDAVASDRHMRSLETWAERFAIMEEQANEDIFKITEDMEIVQRAVRVKGVGPVLAAQLISLIDIEKSNTVSAMWKYCGYAVNAEGRADRRRKGEKIAYNPRAKTLCWNIAASMLRANSPYRKLYDDAKEKYEIERPDWTKAHRHNAALRIMIKRFLSHFWVMWRELEGLPVREPYVHEKLGHTTMDNPADYGW